MFYFDVYTVNRKQNFLRNSIEVCFYKMFKTVSNQQSRPFYVVPFKFHKTCKTVSKQSKNFFSPGMENFVLFLSFKPNLFLTETELKFIFLQTVQPCFSGEKMSEKMFLTSNTKFSFVNCTALSLRDKMFPRNSNELLFYLSAFLCSKFSVAPVHHH